MGKPIVCAKCGKYTEHCAKGLCRNCYRSSLRSREQNSARVRRTRARRKTMILNSLGGKCACCGETNSVFLCVDHINKDGKAHREQVGGRSDNIYKDILKEGCPKDKYRVLCWNCNAAFAMLGYCPHHLPEEVNNA